jgi:hypothetical protein
LEFDASKKNTYIRMLYPALMIVVFSFMDIPVPFEICTPCFKGMTDGVRMAEEFVSFLKSKGVKLETYYC